MRQALVEPRRPLKIEIHRVGVWRSLGAPRLGRDELDNKRAREPSNDFVLQVEEIGYRFFKPLGPQVIAAFGID